MKPDELRISAPCRGLIPYYTPGAAYKVTVFWSLMERTLTGWKWWYLEVNAGGTPHTNEEIERVRDLLAEVDGL